jgi:cobalt/nickel transport protein
MSRKLECIVIAIILIFAAQFFYMSSTTHAEYGGADDKPAAVIDQITDGAYKPIAKPIWKPPSDEIESLLFGLQAATGAIIIGYFLGYYRAKNNFEGDFGTQMDNKLQIDEKIQRS